MIERVVNQLGTYHFSYIEGHTLRQEIVQVFTVGSASPFLDLNSYAVGQFTTRVGEGRGRVCTPESTNLDLALRDSAWAAVSSRSGLLQLREATGKPHVCGPSGARYINIGVGKLYVLTFEQLQVHAEIRTALLIAQRSAHSAEAPPQSASGAAQGSFLGILPRELLHTILMYIGSQRWPPPQPALRWELVNGGDDGLPLDWRQQLSVHCIPT